jgi:hypothetical protein
MQISASECFLPYFLKHNVKTVNKFYFVRGVYGRPSAVAKKFCFVFLVPFQQIQ